MLHFRMAQRPNNKLAQSSSRVLVSRPTSFEELPVEVVEQILSHMHFGDRQRFRQTSSHFRLVHDRFLEHRVKQMFHRPTSTPSSVFLQQFCRLIYESTLFFHRISFPQFMAIFLSHEDLMSIRALHSSVVAKICNAKFIGDMSDVFEMMMLKYLSLVQGGCGTQRKKFKFLLILTIINLLKNCPAAVLRKRQRSKFYIQFELCLQGGWMGSLWPSNERKSMNLSILLVVLLEMDISMKMRQSFRKVTDFKECVTVYGTDVYLEDTIRGPSTKFQFHINTEEPLIEIVDRIITQEEPVTVDDEELIEKMLSVRVSRLFFEVYVTCREARKWGCAENFIIQK